MLKKRTLTSLATELQSLHMGDTICITSENTGYLKELIDTISYQLPLTVTEYTSYATGLEGIFDDYELCPKCMQPLERTYQPYCDKCGQSLQWIGKKGMRPKC